MLLAMIVICLVVQRYLQVASHTRQFAWECHYFTWIESNFSAVMQKAGVFYELLLILPLLIATALVFGLVSLLLTGIVYYILALLLLWYCLDARDLLAEPYSVNDQTQLFAITYQRLFAPLFWFALAGPMGLVAYVGLRRLSVVIAQDRRLPLLALLDWLPLRLLGLSFALVGHFNATLKCWLVSLRAGLQENVADLAKTYGMQALQSSFSAQAVDSAKVSIAARQDAIVTLIERALLLWLVIFALFTIGQWLA